MKPTLLIYSSYDGQTRKIMEKLSAHLPELSCEVVTLQEAFSKKLSDYDRVLIGAAIRYGHFDRQLYRFLAQRHQLLESMPSAFFGVNLTARKAGKDLPETNLYMKKFQKRVVWKPQLIAVFAGALRYHRYNWWQTLLIQMIMKITGGSTDTSKEIEFTNWDKVALFAEQFKTIKIR